jgi:hypothetical protein
LRAKEQIRIALIEVHRVAIGGRVEGVDLLSSDPTPLIFQDRNLAGIASRFSTFLTCVFPMPHYWRLSGTAMIIPDMGQFSAPEIVREIVQHLGGPLEQAEMRRWLMEHFPRFDKALLAVSRQRRQQMFAGMDAKWSKVVYELRAPFGQCRERLDALADVEPETLSPGEQDEGFAEARAWFDPLPQTKRLVPTGGRALLGRVLLGQSLWRLETFGTEKISRMRRQFEEQLGDRVRFSGERVDDMGTRLATKEPTLDEALVPPRLLENPTQFIMATSSIPALPPGVSPEDAEQALRRASDEAFLDEKIPALDNRTPREAARDPVGRPKLVQLMKQRVRGHDEHNLQTGRTDDINWLLRELDLREIMFDAPPWRPPPPPPRLQEEEQAEFANFEGMIEEENNRPPAPPLPEAPLEVDEALKRLENAMGLFATAAEAEVELYASGSTLLDDADELTLDILTEEDFGYAIPFLLQVWFALVPRGCRAPEIDFTGLKEAFLSNLRQFQVCAEAKTQKKLESFFQNSLQPGLMLALMGGFLETANTGSKKFRPSLDAQPVILALLKAVMEKLDEALRRK